MTDDIRTELTEGIVSTIFAQDVEEWETALYINQQWFIAERYLNKDTAITGHEKWVLKLQENPFLDISKEHNEFFEAWTHLSDEAKSIYVPNYKILAGLSV